MNIILKRLNTTALIVASILTGCGGGGGGDDKTPTGTSATPDTSGSGVTPSEPQDARVTVIGVDTAVISTGGSALVNVDVTYGETRVAEQGERVAVVVKIPPGVKYAIDSSGIRTSTSSANVVPVKTDCSDGSSFIAYDFGADELKAVSDPDGREDADFELIFEVDGTGLSGDAVIASAAADNSLSYSCGGDFQEEVATSIRVN